MRGLMKLAGVARFDCIGSTQEFACYMAGLASPGDHTCGWTTSTLHSHLAWRYWFRWGCGASSTTSVIADLAGSHIPYPRSTGPDHAAMHPLRRDTPDPSWCTRSEGVQCLRIGCTASHNKHKCEHSLQTYPTDSIGRRHTASTCSPRLRTRNAAPVRECYPPSSWCNTTKQHAQSRTLPPDTPQPAASDAATRPRNTRTDSAQEPLHPLRRAAPVTSRYTRYVALHPLRRDAPDQKGCNAYGSGAPPPTTSPTADIPSQHTTTGSIGRRHTASTCSPRLRTRGAAPVRERYTTSELV